MSYKKLILGMFLLVLGAFGLLALTLFLIIIPLPTFDLGLRDTAAVEPTPTPLPTPTIQTEILVGVPKSIKN